MVDATHVGLGVPAAPVLMVSAVMPAIAGRLLEATKKFRSVIAQSAIIAAQLRVTSTRRFGSNTRPRVIVWLTSKTHAQTKARFGSTKALS
jgi:hypothetical protein